MNTTEKNNFAFDLSFGPLREFMEEAQTRFMELLGKCAAGEHVENRATELLQQLDIVDAMMRCVAIYGPEQQRLIDIYTNLSFLMRHSLQAILNK